MKLPTLPEVKKFLGSLVAVAGAIVGFGIPNNVAHIVGLVSAVAASLLVFLAKNTTAAAPAPVILTANPPATANPAALGPQPPTDGTAGLSEIGLIVITVALSLAAVIIWAATVGLPTHR